MVWNVLLFLTNKGKNKCPLTTAFPIVKEESDSELSGSLLVFDERGTAENCHVPIASFDNIIPIVHAVEESF